jgi:hypothetical protein
MKSFTATVETDYDNYLIDYKPDNIYNNRFSVSSIRRGAVYVYSIQDALNKIDFYDDQDIERLTLQNELDHNQ